MYSEPPVIDVDDITPGGDVKQPPVAVPSQPAPAGTTHNTVEMSGAVMFALVMSFTALIFIVGALILMLDSSRVRHGYGQTEVSPYPVLHAEIKLRSPESLESKVCSAP